MTLTASPSRLPSGLLLAAAAVLTGGATGIVAQGSTVSVLWILLTSLPWLALIWCSSLGWGVAVARLLRVEAGPFTRAAVGMAVWLWVTHTLGVLGVWGAAPAWGVIGVGLLLGLTFLIRRGGIGLRVMVGPLPWPWLLACPAIGLMLVACCCPPGTMWRTEAMGYDVLSYHLQLPHEWLAMGRFTPLEHNVYSYLPSLMEQGYAQLALLSGHAVRDTAYLAQLWHMTMGLCACAAGVEALRAWLPRTSPTLAALGPVLMLLTPWFTITGTLAYSEMGVLLMGAAAVSMLAHSGARAGAVAGALLGGAALAKLTALAFITAPLLLLPLLHGPRRSVRLLPWLIGGMAVVMSPYLLRNSLATGNPIFPLATRHLGAGPWAEHPELTARWDRAHQPDRARWDLLWSQGPGNAGYAAMGGWPTPPQRNNIAVFDRSNGFPLLAVAVGLGALLAMRERESRPIALACVAWLAWQAAAWSLLTHHQSRFLLPALLPCAMLIGLGARPRWAAGAMALIGTLMIAHLYRLVPRQTLPGFPLPVLVDALPVMDHPLNRYPKAYLVADNSRLLYLTGSFTYHSAFDINPLGEAMRRGEATAWLQQTGHRVVWVHLSELDRLHATYGFDADVTRASLAAIAQRDGWRVVERIDDVALVYALPDQGPPRLP